MTSELWKENPQIPWRKVAGIRDRLAHGYYQISLKIVWETVQNNLPALKTEVTKILAELK